MFSLFQNVVDLCMIQIEKMLKLFCWFELFYKDSLYILFRDIKQIRNTVFHRYVALTC